MLSKVLGVIVIAKNGDRFNYYQDPYTYAGSDTETTALGEVQSNKLGAELRNTYFNSQSPSYIDGISADLVDNSQVKVRVKAGVEGTVVFDSAVALLQGLFPPTYKNKIVLANGTTIVAPLGGYQYVPVETVEPGNDRSLESWTDCPNFEKHVKNFYNSDDFKAKARNAEPFFREVQDYVFRRRTTLENAWNIFDYVNSELTHNRTYAHRLPPTFLEQARHWANYHESGVFSSIAGRTLLHTIITSLERIAFNGEPLRFVLVETTYQAFISLFHQTGVTNERPELAGIPDYASAIAIELRRGSPPDTRDFLRIKFKNGTAGAFNDVHVFGHHADIPLTEFIYRAGNAPITSNKQWKDTCGTTSHRFAALGMPEGSNFYTCFAAVFALFSALFFTIKFVKKHRANRRGVQLQGEENGVDYPIMADQKIRYI